MAILNDGLRQCQLRIARVWLQLPTTVGQLMSDFLADVAALIEVGLVAKTESGRIHVPFEVIEADVELRAA